MHIDEARFLIQQAVESGEWVERATDYSCVTVSGIDYCETEMFDALEQIRREGSVIHMPKVSGSLNYRDVDRFKAAEFIGATSEFVAAGVPRSKTLLEAQMH